MCGGFGHTWDPRRSTKAPGGPGFRAHGGRGYLERSWAYPGHHHHRTRRLFFIFLLCQQIGNAKVRNKAKGALAAQRDLPTKKLPLKAGTLSGSSCR